jgi:uncharacterized DUF497 family protein
VHTIDSPDPYVWDEAKARANVRKHGIEFADAVGVFEDERAGTRKDILTAVNEQRWLTIGRDRLGRIVVVAYTWRGNRIRIFSARRAIPRERREYLAGDR